MKPLNPLELQLAYPFGDTLPAPGTTLAVNPAVRWLRMPLPFALDHINLWLLADEIDGRKGWAIVDCGISNDTTKALWEQVFAQHLEGLPVLRVVCTHMHPDHIGLAHWLTERWQAPLHISMTDYTMARSMSRSTSGSGGDAAANHFSKHGLTAPEDIEKIRKRGDYYGSMVPNVPDSFARMMDGQTLRIGSFDWQLIAGFGHAPEHISLYCAAQGVLISGDMLLPRISTNISVWDLEPLADPLKLFLDSLTRYEALPEDTLVLPSHGRPFRGAHTRVRQLRDHHDERLVEVLAACTTPQTAADIVPVLFKRALDLHQMTFAMGEALAHLHTLWRRGQVQRVVGGDEVVRFVAG